MKKSKNRLHLLLLAIFCCLFFGTGASSERPNQILGEQKTSSPAEMRKEAEISQDESVHKIAVSANAGWTDSGLDVQEDQEIYFEASGEISLQRGNPMAFCGPEGYNLKTVQQPLMDKNIGALIGKVVKLISVQIDKETGEEIRNEITKYFFVGSKNKVRMPITGHLFLGINENVVGDNGGEFTVKFYLVSPNYSDLSLGIF